MAARYSHTAGYSITKRTPRRRAMVHSSKPRLKFGPIVSKLSALAVVGVLAATMIAQSSNTATNAYKQTDVRKEVGKVEQDIERLQLEAQRAQSLQAITQSQARQNLVESTEVKQVELGQVAGVSTDQP
jgi:hypothetical protein